MPRTSKAPSAQEPDNDTLAELSVGEVLIEETPLGLSAEQMAKSNPQAVEQLKAEAAAQAVEADRQRRAQLDAAFADDLAFAAKCFADGKTVEQAKAERHDALVTEITALKTENADLKARVEAGKPSFVPSDAEGTHSAAESDALAEFEAGWAKDPELQKSISKTAFLALAKREPQRARALLK